jgi:undecaprenyl-diphosphatase
VAQAVAIAPGISRSGATIAVGLLLGFNREAAARFSFLLAIPIILGAGAYQLLRHTGPASVAWGPLLVGFFAAFAVGYAAIGGLLRYLRTRSLYPFALYCLLVGALVVAATWLS